jgi:curved DNA-binding protein CbpA
LRNYYELLSVQRNAPADQIKKAFRREIAKYHPDKVQHLGKEFQEMASGIAADLTEGYRILMDAALRAKYDDQLALASIAMPTPPSRPAAPPPSAPPPTEPSPTTSVSSPAGAGAGAASRASAGVDFVRRATLSKLQDAIDEVLVNATPLRAPGFDIALITKPKKGLFKKAEDSICVLVKFVTQVDAEAIAAHWPAAMKARAPGAAGCVLMLIGNGMAPAKELSAAISDLRRKSRTPGPVLVPVDVRDWEALFPPDTPTAVRTIIQRLKDEKR